MDSYQTEEDYARILKAIDVIRAKIEECENKLVLYDPEQNANTPLDVFRRDVKASLQFLPEVNRRMNSLHTDFVTYTRDQVYAILNDTIERIDQVMANLTTTPLPKPKRIRHYRTKQAYEKSQAELSAYAAQILHPMTPREQWRLVQGVMRKRRAKERALSSAS